MQQPKLSSRFKQELKSKLDQEIEHCLSLPDRTPEEEYAFIASQYLGTHLSGSIKDIPDNSKGSDFSRDIRHSPSMIKDNVDEHEYDERSEAFNPSTQFDVVRLYKKKEQPKKIAGQLETKDSFLGFHDAEKIVDKVITQALGAVKGEVENLEDIQKNSKVIKRLSTIERPKDKKLLYVPGQGTSKSILKDIGSFMNDNSLSRKEIINYDTQLVGFKYRAKKNKTMNDFERSEQKKHLLASYTQYYQNKFKPMHDQYRYNLAKVIVKTFETSVASPVSNFTEPDRLANSPLFNSPGSYNTQTTEANLLEDKKKAYIPVNNNIKLIINRPTDPLKEAGFLRTPVSPHPMVHDKRYQTLRNNMKNKASVETLHDLGKSRPTVSSFRKANDNSLPKLSPMKTTMKQKKNKNDKDTLEYLDKFDEKPPAPFLTEGLGLLALHSTRHSQLHLTEDYKPENFKIPISTLRKADVNYFEHWKGINLRNYYYDQKFRKSDDVILCESIDANLF